MKGGRRSSIRFWRSKRGISQADLAARVNIGQPHLSRVERGIVQPRTDLLVRIAGALDVPVVRLIESTGRPARTKKGRL